MHAPTTEERLRQTDVEDKLFGENVINRCVWIEERVPGQSSFYFGLSGIVLEYMKRNEGSLVLSVKPNHVEVSVSEIKNGVFDRRKVADAVTVERAIEMVNEYFD